MRQSQAASRRGRSGAGLSLHGYVAWARQLVRAEPAAASPAIRGTRDAQLATPAEPMRAYRLRGQQIDGTHRLGRTDRTDPGSAHL
jgi:hypothetical protein